MPNDWVNIILNLGGFGDDWISVPKARLSNKLVEDPKSKFYKLKSPLE